VHDGGGNVGLLRQNQIPKGGRELTRVTARGYEARRPKAAERTEAGLVRRWGRALAVGGLGNSSVLGKEYTPTGKYI
jgi:hypothetical protein